MISHNRLIIYYINIAKSTCSSPSHNEVSIFEKDGLWERGYRCMHFSSAVQILTWLIVAKSHYHLVVHVNELGGVTFQFRLNPCSQHQKHHPNWHSLVFMLAILAERPRIQWAFNQWASRSVWGKLMVILYLFSGFTDFYLQSCVYDSTCTLTQET